MIDANKISIIEKNYEIMKANKYLGIYCHAWLIEMTNIYSKYLKKKANRTHAMSLIEKMCDYFSSNSKDLFKKFMTNSGKEECQKW